MKNLRMGDAVFLGVLVLGMMPLLAQAATLNVPAEHLTIQKAINAASDGDTVLVDSGTYKENITFSGKAITVKSVNGTTSTIIDGNKLDSAVTFSTAKTKDAVLKGFTITNGKASNGGGIHCYSSSPTVVNTIFWNDIPQEIFLTAAMVVFILMR